MKKRKVIDISRTLSPETAVWPGDSPFDLEQISSLKQGDSVNLTTITMSAHTGTHVDAPYHFKDQGKTMLEVELSVYWGPAQVVTITRKHGSIQADDFAAYDLTLAPRLLIRSTAGDFPHEVFPELIPYPSPHLADHLGSQGIILYGTDALSVDAVDSKTLPGHHALLQNNIAILEGLNLRLVKDGLYELCALPLKIDQGDGSPVRAALRELD